MRIAYIAPYQGPTLLSNRPIQKNRSMSNRVKIELVASMLRELSHEVEVISPGEVIEHALKYYPTLAEEERFHPEVPVYYASALPVRRLNGLWSNLQTLKLLKLRHRQAPYDAAIVFNLRGPQIKCADHALRQLGIPVILEYEDDAFVNVEGQRHTGFSSERGARAAARLLPEVSGCIAPSPYLLSQAPASIPKLLLRGTIGSDIVAAATANRGKKANIVVFSGTHTPSNGVGQLIDAWRQINLPGWEVHITGLGKLTDSLKEQSKSVPGVVFHGLVERQKLVDLMCSAKICINPHQLSRTPGNVFAFKIIEYLAAGAHVVTTPMGALEPELEAGITYMPDNDPATICQTLQKIVAEQSWTRTAEEAAQAAYGPDAIARTLGKLIKEVRETQGPRQN